jgi:hypothetical protein
MRPARVGALGRAAKVRDRDGERRRPAVSLPAGGGAGEPMHAINGGN